MRFAALVTAVACSLLTACGGGGTEPTYTVSGTITPASAAEGATVTIGTATAVADWTGAWSVTGVPSGTYTVTPAKAGVAFTPAARTVIVGSADLTGVDYVIQGSRTLSGTIRAAGGQRVDVDTADTLGGNGDNDSELSPQDVPSAVTVGGWASAIVDEFDVYRATLAAGQVVTLAIAEPNPAVNDLDLALFAVGDLSAPVAV